jgi:hypothetical protein
VILVAHDVDDGQDGLGFGDAEERRLVGGGAADFDLLGEVGRAVAAFGEAFVEVCGVGVGLRKLGIVEDGYGDAGVASWTGLPDAYMCRRRIRTRSPAFGDGDALDSASERSAATSAAMWSNRPSGPSPSNPPRNFC